MKIILKNGIDQLEFGMKQADIMAALGNPDKNFKDEDHNTIFMYNALKLRLTFYAEEEMRFGYLITSNPEAELFDRKIIGKSFETIKSDLNQKGITKFTKDEFDGYENFFNEDNWIIFQTEFGEITKVEIGAIINDKDEFDWIFKK